MSLQGQIIEFLDSEQLKLAYVRKEERDKLYVVDPRGRNLSVSGDRVVVVYRAAPESEFPVIAREIAEKVAVRQSEIDIELLWQTLGQKQQEFPPLELARIFFGESTPEGASAVFRALSEDNLFFRRKGDRFISRTEDQVQTEMIRRQRQKEREGFRERATAIINRLLKHKATALTPDMEPIIDRIHSWLRHHTGDEVGSLLEDIAGPLKAREAAYEILVRAGRVDAGQDRFLVMAGIDGRFPKGALEAAEQMSPYVHSASRVDYRHLPAFSIDDEDTREIDDALTIERTATETIVGIHIADVSEFVSKGDPLDGEAYQRSSTIYLPAITLRMFPERVSTDLASLIAGHPRPCFSVEVRFDGQGNRIGYRIVLSTIQVQKRMSYDEADEALQKGDPDLQTLHEIAAQLQADRALRGAITFRRPELKIRVRGDEIHVAKINPHSPSRFLVSEMMILANGLAADFASANTLPVIFRTQEPREALALEDTPAVEALAFERLRKTFKKSRLSLSPGMHSGLGLTAYTQASSPIRRYADLVTQRQFTALFRGLPVPYVREELLKILSTAEAAEQEIRAIEERSTTYWLLEYLVRAGTTQPLSAVVLDKKGMIEVEDFLLRGKVAGAAGLEPGANVQVLVENIDSVKGEIRFKLV